MPQQRECVRLKLQLRTMCTASLGDKLERREAKTLVLAINVFPLVQGMLGLSLHSLAKICELRMLMVSDLVFCAQVVTRNFPSLARNYVLQMLMIEEPTHHACSVQELAFTGQELCAADADD
eukprot:scaffold135272_cov24-Tisochrysis_lutea.AAC.1